MPYSLVPYKESMRIGMGLNSYTHKLCMGSVGYRPEGDLKVKESPSSFMYSSRIVDRLSDIATAMEISQSDTIIEGFFDRAGSGTVMSRTFTTSAPDDFQGVGGFDPGSDVFHEAFGDSYISGFVEGGYFIGFISICCLDGSDKSSVIQAVREIAQTKTDPSDVNETP
ncbi:hypothetical protein FSPOR_2711 [Fusarium sporotrichioides]|uniref:Uncharacterized protein n=1 Tax=Fusarium sporotrichioides TaxID=5514 RepID=A0A395SJ91_FUSSP|nr:hypothetical protein FSPOR_2711 [Fusarium sporotrichioides]